MSINTDKMLSGYWILILKGMDIDSQRFDDYDDAYNYFNKSCDEKIATEVIFAIIDHHDKECRIYERWYNMIEANS